MQRTLDKIVMPEPTALSQRIPSAEGPYVLTVGKTIPNVHQSKRALSNIPEDAYKRATTALDFFNKQNFNVIK